MLNTATGGNGQVALAWSAPVSNGGSAVTGYKVYRGTSSGAEVLLASPAGTGTSYTDLAAVNGTTYFYKVSAVNGVGEGSFSNERSATPTPLPTAPGAPVLNTATGGNGQVALAWSAPVSNGGSAVTGYKVYRGTSPGGESLLATPAGTGTSYTDLAAVNGTTYFYKVSAVNGVGEGALSNERSATPVGPPGPPVLASASPGNNAVALSWGAPASNGGSAVTGYKVYRGTSPAGESLLAAPAGTGTSFTDLTAVNGTTYYYKVPAANANGDGSLSNELWATPATVPAAPALTAATAGNNQVALAWSAPAPNGGSPVTGYRVYRGTTSGVVTLLAAPIGTGTTYLDLTATNGTTYFYKVAALNFLGEGAPSNELSATPATLPGAPVLTAASPGNNSVALAWSAPVSNGGSAVTGYKVYRGTSAGAEVLLASPAGTGTSYTDLTASNGTTYFYKVSAVNGVGEGARSNERSAIPAPPTTPPAAPSNLNAIAQSQSRILLTWTDNASNETGFRIERSWNGVSDWQQIGTIDANTTAFAHSRQPRLTTYFYRVRATNDVGDSGYSNVATATTLG